MIRLQRGYTYTTGDSQYETSEYTWEDFDMMKMSIQKGIMGTKEEDERPIINDILKFFQNNPEKLLAHPKAKNYTVNDIENMLSIGVSGSISEWDMNINRKKVNYGSYFDKSKPYMEMATIAIDEKLNINVNPETERLNIAYFKVLNAESFRKATKVARLHFKDSGMEYHEDGSGKQLWILNSKEIKHIIKLLKEPNDSHDGYTNWQIACYQWNLENGLIKKFKDYFEGKYDHIYDNDSRLKEAYVPSTQKMPETWEY